MDFCNLEHEAFFKTHKHVADRGDDYAALVYTLGINEVCRSRFGEIFNDGIKPEAIGAEWQTGASRRITRLAFNLFTWDIPAGDDPTAYTPKALLSSLDDEQKKGAMYAMIEYT